jgi:glycosyltransferase involved in cell wall biosynthesis
MDFFLFMGYKRKRSVNNMSDKKVSVIMASYLGDYPGRATNPEQKFIRAVKSFLTQTYENKELIIVADGCDTTERLYQYNFSDIDVLGKRHLEKILNQFNTDEEDLVYYDDYLVLSSDFKKLHKRVVEPRYGSIGTSSITHIKTDWLKWTDGYGHDWIYVMSAITGGLKFKKLKKSPEYLVCHWGGSGGRGDF